MVMNTQPQPKRVGESAVVIGASMAGLCAARVLADRFDHVTGAGSRPPPRALQPGGSRSRRAATPTSCWPPAPGCSKAGSPGSSTSSTPAGAVELDLTADLYWHQGGGVARRPDLVAQRPIDVTAVPRVDRPPAARIAPRTSPSAATPPSTASSLDPTRTRVTAVRLEGGDPVPCNLVVDATGRRARSLSWLAGLGYARTQGGPRRGRHPLRHPGAATDRAATSAATGRWRGRHRPTRPPNASPWPCPSRATAGWSLFGGAPRRDAPPTDDRPASRLRQDRSPRPSIADILEASEPLGEPVTHRFPSSQRRHVERLKRFPLGWVPLGDAVGIVQPHLRPGHDIRRHAGRRTRPTALDRSGAADRPVRPPVLQGREPRREHRRGPRRSAATSPTPTRPARSHPAPTSSTGTWTGSSSPHNTTTPSPCDSTKSSPWSADLNPSSPHRSCSGPFAPRDGSADQPPTQGRSPRRPDSTPQQRPPAGRATCPGDSTVRRDAGQIDDSACRPRVQDGADNGATDDSWRTRGFT